jgi:hypothetical protein
MPTSSSVSFPFDPAPAAERLARCWALPATFGIEEDAVRVYLDELVSDRYALVRGMQLLRDELHLADGQPDPAIGDAATCGADLSLPSVLTTLAHTNCGDRIHQGEATATYNHILASRFATMSELGEYKPEAFSPTGGGTDDGRTLAHVTVSHALDGPVRERLYGGHPASYLLVNCDLKTHVGRIDTDEGVRIGITRESRWREARNACGAILGTLRGFSEHNAVHRRLRADLGEDNFQLLSTRGVTGDDGTDLTAVVAAAIVAVRGMEHTAHALEEELDERGLGHLTASVTVNRPHMNDTLLYLARATVFHGETRLQGFGTDATRYSGRMVIVHDDPRIQLTYDGLEAQAHPIRSARYGQR